MIDCAMFDEVDENTTIFKLTGNMPDGEDTSKFVDSEDLPDGFYFNLVGWNTKLLRAEIKADDVPPLQSPSFTTLSGKSLTPEDYSCYIEAKNAANETSSAK